jgi:Right handed beta helix region
MHNEFGVDIGSSGIVASRDETDGITEYAVIRRNEVWENWGQGINIHHANYVSVEENTSHDNYTANIYIHDTTNVLCQRNFFYMVANDAYMGDLGPKVGIMMGEEYSPPIVENIQVINNIAYGNHRNLFWYSGNYGGGMTNVLIANNTFVNGIGSPSNGNCNIILDPAVNSNVRFENNIVLQEDGLLPVIGTLEQPGVSYSHNLWSENPVSAASGPGDWIGDPQLARIGQPYSVNWFFLTSASPAINAALSLPEVVVDFLGNYRKDSPDIGAI